MATMKVDIETYYEWVNDDGCARRCTKEDLDAEYTGPWPEVTPIYLVVTANLYICESSMLDMAELVAEVLRTRGGQTKLEAVAVTRALIKK